jgi:GNAT superfamily N-acetyltransferase
MQIIEVGNNPKLRKEFIALPVSLYKGNQYWIRPLDKDVEDVFDSEKNKFFKNGECMRWIATDDNGQTVGRVAAFINHTTAIKDNDQPTGGMGFFECIEDQNVAFALFDKCKNWLAERGMEAMDGPINFGERDRFWGLLVEGYDKEPTYGMGYHHRYYADFFTNYGFETYFKQFTYKLPIPQEKVMETIHPAFFERAQRIYANPEFTFKHIEKKHLKKYSEDFREVYNKAWANHLGVGDMTAEKAHALMLRMKPILDEELVWFGYHKGEPVAFFIMLPELNQIFKHVNGKLDLIGKLKFLYHKLMKTNKKVFGVIFGVTPEYQKRGVESAIALSFSKVAWKPNYQYEELELNWIGDFNRKMMKFVELLGTTINKTHITYRYLFDRSKPFERHKMI